MMGAVPPAGGGHLYQLFFNVFGKIFRLFWGLLYLASCLKLIRNQFGGVFTHFEGDMNYLKIYFEGMVRLITDNHYTKQNIWYPKIYNFMI